MEQVCKTQDILRKIVIKNNEKRYCDMKRIMVLALLFVFTLVMSTSAFAAASDDPGRLERRIETLDERQQRIEELKIRNQERQAELASKKDEFEAFRKDLAEKRLAALANREANITMIEQNNQLHLDLALKLKELKDSGSTLPDETIAQLKDYNAQIKELIDSLKESKGQIREVLDEYKELIKEKDYAAMDAAFAEITTIQSYRNDVLCQINTILVEMNSILI